MAYTIASGSVMQIIFRGSCFTQNVMNVFHYRYDGPVIANGQTFLLNVINTNAQMQANTGLWQGCISQDVTTCRIVGQWIWPQRYRAFNAAMVADTGALGPAGSANAAAVVTLVADQGSRHGVGNKHLPGVALAAQSAGLLTGGQVIAMGNFGTAMATSIPILGGVLQPVIFNRAAPASSLEVVDSEVNGTVRVQRRRTVGLGE